MATGKAGRRRGGVPKQGEGIARKAGAENKQSTESGRSYGYKMNPRDFFSDLLINKDISQMLPPENLKEHYRGRKDSQTNLDIFLAVLSQRHQFHSSSGS